MSRVPIPEEVQDRVRTAAKNRCGYCLCLQHYMPDWLQIDHILAHALGGSDEEENLWLACGWCNRHKSFRSSYFDPVSQETVSLYNPRLQNWKEHFQWDDEGVQIFGLTPVGRTTVAALLLNHTLLLKVRRNWVKVGWHPPEDSL